jgi:hypothetical protein
MSPTVRYCTVAGSESTGAEKDSTKAFDFLIYETYAFNKWNSTITHELEHVVCGQKLISNETDLVPVMFNYPSYYEYMDYITLLKDGKFTILSSYTPVNLDFAKTKSTDSLSGFASFSPAVNLAVALFIIAFYSLFKRFYPDRKSEIVHMKPFAATEWSVTLRVWKNVAHQVAPFNIMVGMLLKQYSACSGINAKHSLTFRYILLLVMSFLSILHFMFVSFERTELVVIDKPVLLDSYQAVLDNKKVIPNWISYENGHIQYKNAKEGSMKHRIWQKAREHCPVDFSGCLVPLSKENAVSYMKKIVDQDIVIISGEFANSIAHAGMCPLARELSPNPMILRIDPNEEAVPLGIGYNKLLDESMPQVAKTVTTRGRRTHESGIVLKLLIPTRSPIASLTSSTAFWKCLHPEEDGRDSMYKSKPWKDYQRLMMICTSLIMIAVTIHLFTIRNFRKRSHKHHKRLTRHRTIARVMPDRRE